MRTLILDLDGTLLDSALTCTEILNDMLADRGTGGRVALCDVRPHVTAGGEEMIAAVLGVAGDAIAVELADFRARYAVRPTLASALFPGVAKGLRRLRNAGYRMAICSNKPQNLCEKVVADLGLSDCFDHIVGSQPDFRKKPHPDLVELAMSLLGESPDNCLFVGDSMPDRLASAAAGLAFLYAAYGYEDVNTDMSACEPLGSFSAIVSTIMSHEPALALPALRAA